MNPAPADTRKPSMNDQHILQYLARKPDSRAQDLADFMDVDLKVASDALRCLVDEGDVVRFSGVARNGVQSQLYKLSDTFMKSRDYTIIKSQIDAAAQAVSKLAPEPPPAAPAPAPAPAPSALTPMFSAQTEMVKITKVQIAVDLLKAKGTATDDDMRAAMGLVRTSSPAAYLASALKSGRVVREGGIWRMGTGAPPAKPSTRAYNTTFAKPKDEPKAQFKPTEQPESLTKDDVKDLPPAVVEQLSKPAQALAEQPSTPGPVESCKHDTPFRYECEECQAEDAAARPKAPPVDDTPNPIDGPVYRCGLWSDGVLELQRDGRTVVTTTRREHEFMADFLRRSLGAVDKVAA